MESKKSDILHAQPSAHVRYKEKPNVYRFQKKANPDKREQGNQNGKKTTSIDNRL
jgi:hypothetical protein